MRSDIFISWSGELSQQLGEAIKNWLPYVIQTCHPYFSPDDIEKGAKWDGQISSQLSNTNIGIICLTKENQHKPWILFEAGSLSKSMDKSRVCPLLFDMVSSDVTGPLATFQLTEFNREDFRKLIGVINDVNDNKIGSKNLDHIFEKWWPELDDKIKSIIDSHKKNTAPAPKKRSERDILEEVLELVRRQRAIEPNLPIKEAYREAFRDLMGSIFSLGNDLISQGNGASYVGFISHIEAPLRHICRVLRLHDEFFQYKRQLSLLLQRMNIEDDETGSDFGSLADVGSPAGKSIFTSKEKGK